MVNVESRSSMPDVLTRILSEIRERLDEIRPAALEHAALTQALRALDEAIEPTPAAGDERRRCATAPPNGSSSVSGASAPSNRERVVAALEQRPGVSRAELQAVTKLPPRVLAQHLRRLVAAGRVRECPLPGAETGYVLVAPEPATRARADGSRR
jgi:hypothetical protein